MTIITAAIVREAIRYYDNGDRPYQFTKPRTWYFSDHSFKYRLAFVVDGICVLRYDNETHKGKEEASYEFVTPQMLLIDFWNKVDNWRP